jgi:acetamidase/formamidase
VFARDYPGFRDGDPFPDIPPGTQHIIRTARVNGRNVALVSDAIHVPLQPFMGTMAVAPPMPTVGRPGVALPGVQSSRPPGPYGGNMDFKSLTIGSTLYLPVFQKGALFYTGDPHTVQGDGEVSGTALEQSLTGVFRFVLHKKRALAAPRAEDAAYHYVMGIDVDLDRAMRLATAEAVKFLVEEKKLTPAKAFSLASLAVDFHVAEAVDLTQVVVGKIPKQIFLR